MDLYAKLRTLASADVTLQGYFGNPANATFRWFKQRLQPGYLGEGTCVRVKRVTTRYGYTNAPTGLMNLSQPLLQIDVMDFDNTRLQAATAAVISWLGTVNFATDDLFLSPPTTPPNSPNFLANRLSGEEAQVDPPGQAWVEILEVRLWNKES